MREYIHYFLFFLFFLFFWDILYLVSPNVSFITISGRPPPCTGQFWISLVTLPTSKNPWFNENLTLLILQSFKIF